MHKARERLAKMERRHLLAACIVVVLLAAAVVAATIALVASTQKPTTTTVTMSGAVACLPHKGDTHTLECALGLHTDDGRYYALERTLPGTLNTGQRIQVKGTLTTGENSTYDTAGRIAVSELTQL